MALQGNNKYLLPLGILGAGILVVVLLVATKPAAKPVVVKEKAWLISTQEARPGSWAPVLTLYGRVESLWSSTLTAGVAADVLSVQVLEGDRVSHGDLLVSLDERDARLLLAQREAELAQSLAGIATENSRHAADRESLPRERRLLELKRAEVNRLIKQFYETSKMMKSLSGGKGKNMMRAMQNMKNAPGRR